MTLITVTELRLTGKSEDGTHLTLTDAEDTQYTVRISDTLRATVNQPRLSAVRADEGETISVREIQARLRMGEPAESIARSAQCPIDKIDRFAGPIVQERAYIIALAQNAIVRKESGRDPVNFLAVIASRLAPSHVDVSSLEWTTWRLEDASWIIRLEYPNREGFGSADWSFDLARKSLSSLDDGAHWMMGEETPPVRTPIERGMIYGNHPTGSRTPESTIGREGPRLVSIRETPDEESSKDGVTARAKVPSWDEIMFGGTKKTDEDSE
ncbi:MAG: DUF3071 domain-containing protein [Actinobacteria bacterium]|nr:DUF3071 domain-containing protein [Actinomycetota bacterium]MSW57364.1 DUF3071 domain-containing protein [Actinomycetota bacterium]MSX47888.1 DUF3071 domain-containing protein [Actinomycetota bacterium]MSX61763.1 DUF3071 domain-containing protein [Actinomycetota bacterium]MSY09415.1 DUF3071 domain-containing protein [Actinomycetota bacterium]